ncbi:MAG: ArnT family glycosyltransferase, partial [Bacteroidota bacterium]
MFRPLLHKSVVVNYDFKDWTNNYIWLHKPPLSLWFMATSMELFGVNELALRLPSIIVSTLSIALTYKIAINLYPEIKMIGLMAMFFQSINGFVIEISGGRIPTDHVDTLLLFWIELGVWIAVRQPSNRRSLNKIFLIVIVTTFAVLTKWLVGLFIPFLLFCFEYTFKNKSIYINLGQFFIAGVLSIIIPTLWAV